MQSAKTSLEKRLVTVPARRISSRASLMEASLPEHERTQIISILKVKNSQDIHRVVKEGLDSMGDLGVTPEDKTVIKPNLCAIRSSETGTTTDPRVVEAIVRYLKDEYNLSDISIVESDGMQVLADMAFKLLGYEELSRRLKVKLVNLSKSPFSTKLYPDNVWLKKIRVPSILENARLIISVPKIKIHDSCSLTATLKNQFGCNPHPKKSIYHKRLHDAIVDLNAAYKPNLIVVDGIIAMESDGPIGGIPLAMNTLMFGRDAVAMDHVIAQLMGIDANKVRYLVEATRRLGKSNCRIAGNIAEAKRKFRPRLTPDWYNFYGLFNRSTRD